ncbi:RSP_7527 family protein [Neptuniibacter halophilus]|uniref:RSP_7527 family protein n=1 Tax=Neptuniibacter halophilus TaxID=651666 RepID=UPI002573BF77|nr:hypothetical protein [Neptuniibacter halophilus]
MKTETVEYYIEEARKQRSEFTAELFSLLVKKIKSLLQIELPQVIPGPLAHR